MSLQAPIKDLPLDQIDISLSGLRISRPGDVDQMCHSMKHHGQLQAVVVRRLGAVYQLLDGSKRYQGVEKLGATGHLSSTIRDFKKFTSKAIVQNMLNGSAESRKE
ncbi:MAG TPA: hypothetical protein ENN08_04345 [Bacteroidales bacterium]|nr:hypothetical protein [Bacteroidales bacterium]